MFARVTQFEIDTMRIGLPEALARFQELIVPALEGRPGYSGAYAMHTQEGKGILLTFWETEKAATSGVESGFYDEQVAKFVMFTKQPPGRDHYEVVFSQVPQNTKNRVPG